MDSIKEEEEIIKNIIKKGIIAAIKINNIAGFEFLNEKEKDMNIKLEFDSGKKMLHYATKYNSVEIAEILITKGADINAKDIIYQILIIISFLINII